MNEKKQPGDQQSQLQKRISELELEIQELKIVFNETERSGKIGGWKFNPKTLKQTWSDEIFHILELDMEQGAPEVPEGLDFIDPAFRPMAEKAIQRAMEHGEPYNQEWIVTTGSGNKKWVNAVCNPKTKKGKVVSISGSFQDISSKKLAEIELTKSEERFRNVLDNSPFPVAVVDEKDQNILYWSKNAVELFGHKPKTTEEWYELAYPDPDYRNEVIERWKPFLETAQSSSGAINTGKYEITCKDGSVKICELFAQFIPGYLIVTLSDITENKKSEEQLKSNNQQLQANEQQLRAANQQLQANEQQLRAANQQLQANEQQLRAANQKLTEEKKKSDDNSALLMAALENSQAGIAIAEVPSGKLTYVNKAGLLIRDSDYDKVVKNIDVEKYVDSWQILHLDGTPYRTDEVPLARAVLFGEKSSKEFIVRRDNNEDRYVWANAAPVKNQKGEQIAAIVVFMDITEKKITAEKIDNNQYYLEKAQEIGKIGTWELDLLKNQLLWTDESYKIFGIPLGTPMTFELFLECIHPGDREYVNIEWNASLKSKIYDIEHRLLLGDKVKWVREKADFEFDKNGNVVKAIGFTQDITVQKQNEKELLIAKEKAEESERQLKLISDNFVSGMLYQVAMLDEDRRQFNYISKNVTKLYGCTVEEAKENAHLIYGMIHPEDIKGLIQKEKEALRNMSIFETEARVLTPDGDIRWAYYISQPRIIDGIVCWDGIEIDITERKQMELDLIEAKTKAEESDRLKSAFLANMSHEIRTPMNGIIGFSNLLKEPEVSDERQKEYIRLIEKSGERLLITVNDLIDISIIESGQMKISMSEFDISKLTEDLFNFFEVEAERKELQLFLNRSSLANSLIEGDKNKIYSILTNLIKNAIKYTTSGSIHFGYQKKVDELQFFVKDSGNGIPEENLDSIFDRFVRNELHEKEAIEGSGLGLSISKAYVEMLGGKIWVKSEIGVGSEFYFTIPYKAVERNKSETENIDTKSSVQIKDLKVLIAEDDEMADNLLSIYVKKLSREILHSKNGVETIELCNKNPDMDLILMDIQMPGINGYEATKLIRAFNKDVIIIAQTAFAMAGDRERSLEAGCNDYISKPVKQKELLKKIEKHIINKK